MREKWPFVWAGKISEAERIAICAEILSFSGWAISNVPCLTDRRDYIALNSSDKAGTGTDGKSHLGIGTEGTFRWRPRFECPTIRVISDRLLEHFGSHHLGMVMVSRMLPGAVVSKHRDLSSYYESHHRVQVCVEGNEQTRFVCDGQTKIMRLGEMWTFRNLAEHEVFNEGQTTRFALVIDVLDKDYVFPQAV